MLTWRVFLERLGPDYQTRLEYLQRHPPAPYLWAYWVDEALYPDQPWEKWETGTTQALEGWKRLTELGLIESDWPRE